MSKIDPDAIFLLAIATLIVAAVGLLMYSTINRVERESAECREAGGQAITYERGSRVLCLDPNTVIQTK